MIHFGDGLVGAYRFNAIKVFVQRSHWLDADGERCGEAV